MRPQDVVLFALVAVSASTGCSRPGEPDAGEKDAPEASAAAETGAAQKRDAKRQATPPADPVPDADAQVAIAPAPAPKEPLRFDMTQDGQAQTAEKFDAWMDAQGVRVAEGADAEAGPVTGTASAGGTAAGTKVQATAEETRR